MAYGYWASGGATVIQLLNVSKVFGTGVAGLSEINLDINKGEFIFLIGPTGSGKTTLLRLLTRELIPTEGNILVDEWDIVKLPDNQIPILRKKFGVIFQDLKLLTDRTIFENVLLPLQVAGRTLQEAKNRVEELLEEVGVLEHKDKFPIQLSGGELQRVAIARALALSPDVLLADEPTGNLDEKTAFEIVDLLSRINQNGTTIIMATHNPTIVEKMKKRVVGLDHGKLVMDKKHSHQGSNEAKEPEEPKGEHHQEHHKKESEEKK